MRSTSIVLAVALASSLPAIAAPVPHVSAGQASTRSVQARAPASAVTKEVLDFFAGIIGSIGGKAATNAALGNNIDGSEKSRRDLDERAGAAALLKPLLKSAASSAAVSGFFAGISALFGGNDDAPARRELSLDERAGAAGLLGPLLKSAASSAAVGGFFAGISSLFGGNDAPARRAAPVDAQDLIAQIESGGLFTQEQLDEVEAELEKTMGGSSIFSRDLDARALKLGGLTKGLVGIIGSVAGSFGIDALFGSNDGAARRAAPVDGADLIAQIQSGTMFTQEQLDEVESELQRTIGGTGLFGRDLEARALKLGGLTKGLVGIIGSVAGSFGIDALFGNNDNARRAQPAEITNFINGLKLSDIFKLFGREETIERRDLTEILSQLKDSDFSGLAELLGLHASRRATSLNELD